MGFLPSGDPAEWKLEHVGGLIHNLTILALDLAGIVATIFIVIGAFNYLTAFGNEERATAGKNTLTWAIIGLVVIIVSQVILGAIWQLFSGSPLPV